MATKRRKMWAVVDDEGRGSQVFLSLKSAKRWAAHEPRDGTGWHVVPYLERLPGDVVRTKDEEVAAGKHAAERLESWLKDMKMENLDECDHIRQSCGDVGCTRPVTDAIALLRGRR